MLTLNQIQVIMPIRPPETAAEYVPHLNAAMEEFGINTPDRQAAFLAQLAHESRWLTRLEEIPWTEYRCACGWKGRRLARGGLCAKCGQYAGLTTVKYPDCYEGREKLGNTQPGDGVRFKGRGPIMLTGRANYRAASLALLPGEWACRRCGWGVSAKREPKACPEDGPFVETVLERYPERLLEPALGFRVAAWFWATHPSKTGPLNEIADVVADRMTAQEQRVARAYFDDITMAINGGLRGANERWTYYLRAREVLGQPQDKEEGRTT